MSTSGLIGDMIPAGGAPAIGCQGIGQASWPYTLTPGTSYLGNFLPVSKIGNDNFVYAYTVNGANWLGLSAVTMIECCDAKLVSNATISVNKAYNMDKKIDDGLPTTGSVQATYINSSYSQVQQAPNTTTSGGNSSSCYDTATNLYSTGQNNGSNPNCALSFKFQ